MIIWLQFVLCTGLIVLSGSCLSRYGDVIAEKTGMGQTWVGVLLMAAVTSFPELITGISSVTLYDLPNIAAGDVLGSCVFNLAILAAFDVGRRRDPMLSVAQQGHALTAAFGIVLLGIAGIGIAAADSIPALGWIGINSLILLVLYPIAMRAVFRFEKKRIAEFLSKVSEKAKYDHISKSKAYVRFAICGVVILFAGAYLPHVADEIARVTGLGRTFVGSTFVAISTSLPEIVVTKAALGLGAVDLAVGNLLGSNLFNLTILAIDDLFYWKGPLLRRISPSHVLTILSAMTMTAIVMVALLFPSKKKILYFSWDSMALFLMSAATILLWLVER